MPRLFYISQSFLAEKGIYTMLQCFLDEHYISDFHSGTSPTLAYVCNVPAESSQMPRTLHEHDSLVEILLIYEGAGLYIIDQERYTAKKGDLIFYDAHSVHDEFGGRGSKQLSTYCIGLSGLYFKDLEKDKILPLGCAPILSSGRDFPELFALFQAIERESRTSRGTEVATLLARALALKAHRLLVENGVHKEIRPATLAQQIRAYLDGRYKEDLHLADIAEAMHANSYYCSHIFKTETGFSPMQYVTQRRLGEAQNLLINTKMSITEIASRVGYNNSNYFQSVFRRVVAMTPGAYRKKWTV